MASAGDTDGDGRPDVVVGAPGHDDEPDKRGYAQVLWTFDGARRLDPLPETGPILRYP